MTVWYKVFVLAPCALICAWAFARKLHWVTLPFFIQLFMSVLWLYPFPHNQYEMTTYLDRITVQFVAFSSFLWFVFIFYGVASIPKKAWVFVEKLLAWFCALNALTVVIQMFLGVESYFRVGFLYNASINGCAIAVTYPFALKYYPRFHSGKPLGEDWIMPILFWVFPIWACYLGGSSMSLGAIAVCLAIVLYVKDWGGSWLSKGLVGSATVSMLLAAGYFFPLRHALFDTTERTWMWRYAFKFWWTDSIVNHWIGTGLGSCQIFLPYVQQTNKFLEGEWFIWMHNDWLQVLFEQGYIGFVTLLTASLWLLWKLRRDALYFPALLTFAAVACGNWPVHQSVFAVIFAVLVIGGFRRANKYW